LDFFIKQESLSKKDETFQLIFQGAFEKFSLNRKFQQENKLNIDLINWSDVGGLSDIKQIIADTITLPLNYPSLFSTNESQLGITRS
jgi:SpoVK/Ycf46/Vps4 family AAA+-type ATPase